MAVLNDTIINGKLTLNGGGSISANPSSENDIVNKQYVDDKCEFIVSIGKLRLSDSIYDSATVLNALVDAYSNAESGVILQGLMFCQLSSVSGNFWFKLDGIKSSASYGYITATTYTNDGLRTITYLLFGSQWSIIG